VEKVLTQIRRLQALTLALVLAAIAVLAGERLLRKPAAPPKPAEVDPAALRDAVEVAVKETLKGRADPGEALRALEAIKTRLEGVEKKANEAATAAAQPSAVRLVRLEHRWLARIVPRAGSLRWKLLPLAGPEAGPYPTADETGSEDGWKALVANGKTARIELPPDHADLVPGVLFVGAIVRTDRDAGEAMGAPNRLWLSCATGEESQLWDLAGQFFPMTKGTRTDDALLRSSSTTAAFVVGPGSKLELRLDADALARSLAIGALDVYVRAGPLVAIAERGGHQ
jgi:hypothetical protein